MLHTPSQNMCVRCSDSRWLIGASSVIFRVTVLECEKLENKDTFGKNDVFVKARVSGGSGPCSCNPYGEPLLQL